MHTTRFKELGYDKTAPGLWRIIDRTDHSESAIGPHYTTRDELTGDLERFAAEFGCEGTARPAVMNCEDVQFSSDLVEFRATEVGVWPITERGREWFRANYGDGVVSVTLKKSGAGMALVKLSRAGLSHSVCDTTTGAFLANQAD